jgi:hypothetical protein
MITIENQGYGDFLIKMTADPTIVRRVIDRVMPHVFDYELNVDDSIAWAYTSKYGRRTPVPLVSDYVYGYGGCLVEGMIHVNVQMGGRRLDGTAPDPTELDTAALLDVAFVIRQLMKE